MRLKILLLALMGSLLAACSNQNTPEAVTKAFMKAWAAKDYEEAKKYATKSSATAINAMKLAGIFMKKNQPVEITKEDVICKTENGKTTCTFCCAQGYENVEYEVVQEDGEWKVVFKDIIINDVKNAVSEEVIEQAEGSLKDIKAAVDTLVSN